VKIQPEPGSRACFAPTKLCREPAAHGLHFTRPKDEPTLQLNSGSQRPVEQADGNATRGTHMKLRNPRASPLDRTNMEEDLVPDEGT
jgi:hypothetical protein